MGDLTALDLDSKSVVDLVLAQEAVASIALDGETQAVGVLPPDRHLHRPDLKRPLREGYVKGTLFKTYPCAEFGCPATMERRA